MDSGKTDLSSAHAEFVARWLGNVAETALMHVWVRKMKRGRVQDRILAITRFRIVTFKYSTFAKAMCRNGHFFELRSATWKDDGENVATLDFGLWRVVFQSPEVRRIMETVVRAYRNATSALPDDALCAFDVPVGTVRQLANAPRPRVTDGEAVLTMFEAACSLVGCSDADAYKTQLRNCVRTGHRVLDVGQLGSPSEAVCRAVAYTLRHTTYFSAVTCRNKPLGDAQMDALAGAAVPPSGLRRVSLAGVEGGLSAARAWGRALQQCADAPLLILDLSHNFFGDRGFSLLTEGLARCARLRTLRLANCGAGAAAVAALLRMLCGNAALSGSLRCLSLSHNQLGSKGTAALVTWLASEAPRALAALEVADCGLDLLAVVPAVRRHLPALRLLDVSAARLTPEGAAALAEFAASCSALHHLCIGGMEGDPWLVASVAGAFVLNKRPRRSKLVLDNTDFRTRTDILYSALAASHTLHALHLSGCALAGAALPALAAAVTGRGRCLGLRELDLDRALVGCAPGDRGAAVEALVRLVGQAQLAVLSLQYITTPLSLAGDAAAGTPLDLLPVFAALETNASLEELHVAGNRIRDVGARALFRAVKRHPRMRVLRWLPDSDVTMLAFAEAKACLQENRVLQDVGALVVPEGAAQTVASTVETERLLDEVRQQLRLNASSAASADGGASATPGGGGMVAPSTRQLLAGAPSTARFASARTMQKA